MSHVHPNGIPVVSPAPTTITIRFTSLPPVELKIKYKDNDTMKTPGLSQVKQVPSLFQIASYFEDFFPPPGFRKAAPLFRQIPFAHLMTQPGKLRAILATAITGDGAAAPNPARRRGRTGGKTNGGNGDGKPSNDPAPETKSISFSLKAPAAKSVKLAADFTNWEQSPMELKPSRNGLWTGVIQLAPGRYTYRFIVDGQWCDDPQSSHRAPNPFGTENAVMVVT